MSDLNRRHVLHALATIPAGVALGAVAQGTAQEQISSASTLVAYFSRTGNTRVIAHQIQRARSANIFEIAPSVPYPEDYEQTVEQARQETANGFRPDLTATVENIARYDTVYLGTPIWGMTAPPIIRSFLAAHDVGGKTIVPFITHGGYGIGSSLTVLAEHAPGSTIGEPFVMEADGERRTLEQVTGWLGGSTP
jgi:flavodoxin